MDDKRISQTGSEQSKISTLRFLLIHH